MYRYRGNRHNLNVQRKTFRVCRRDGSPRPPTALRTEKDVLNFSPTSPNVTGATTSDLDALLSKHRPRLGDHHQKNSCLTINHY
jgi:hypothetical protein